MAKLKDGYVRGFNNGFTIGYFTNNINGALTDSIRSLKKLNPDNPFITGLAEGMEHGLRRSMREKLKQTRLKVVSLLMKKNRTVNKDKTQQR